MINEKYKNLREKVTLSAIIGHPKYTRNTIRAILYSQQQILFNNVQILSCEPIFIPNIKYIPIPQLSYIDYSYFKIKLYNNYIDTEYLLHIHDDGFIINPEAWTDEFLNYDYNGALWPVGIPNSDCPVTQSNRCGNGGFTLRSKRFLEVSQKFCPFDERNEDSIVCRTQRDIFLKNNIKYTPDHLAAKFSIEYDTIPEAIGQTHSDYKTLKSFGFHMKNSNAQVLLEKINF